MRYQTDDIRISGMQELLPPESLMGDQPISESSSKLVFESRNKISQIINQNDDRLIVVVGPCSIHDTKAALDYAGNLFEASKKYEETLQIIMRVYFEKDLSAIAITNKGFDEATVKRVVNLIDKSEYKRRQAPPGVRITDRGFGKDRRYPITNKYSQ